MSCSRQTTLSPDSGHIIHIEDFKKGAECTWIFDVEPGNSYAILMNVMFSKRMNCNKASLKIGGTEFCDKENQFCVLNSKDQCNDELLMVPGCQTFKIDGSPVVEYKGKKTSNEEIKMYYNILECENSEPPETSSKNIRRRVPTTQKTKPPTSSSTLKSGIKKDSPFPTIYTTNNQTYYNQTEPAVPNIKGSQKDYHMTDVVLPLILFSILFAVLLVFMLYTKRKQQYNKNRAHTFQMNPALYKSASLPVLGDAILQNQELHDINISRSHNCLNQETPVMIPGILVNGRHDVISDYSRSASFMGINANEEHVTNNLDVKNQLPNTQEQIFLCPSPTLFRAYSNAQDITNEISKDDYELEPHIVRSYSTTSELSAIIAADHPYSYIAHENNAQIPCYASSSNDDSVFQNCATRNHQYATISLKSDNANVTTSTTYDAEKYNGANFNPYSVASDPQAGNNQTRDDIYSVVSK
ncbi:uncharacterized protein LOC120343242 [Styela clava]